MSTRLPRPLATSKLPNKINEKPVKSKPVTASRTTTVTKPPVTQKRKPISAPIEPRKRPKDLEV
jgi:hypothetical protein